VSKNVAVFVDVANIFYAAKAAGIDIDYVTLLKSATAGRDFVRAYAYTGLDPENENQRQFHSFLARNGYKVISKDIRKYGDGRIKANLDIELVVDMMKTARNLDIAVVVSGDGDFAPAIRAVQEQGVRVEVISFRGNTSSDLIEVADLFTDIAQIARVDKSSARSGRRVAAEGDLSMTEVPEKETEGAPRRRRGGRGREDRVAEPVVATAASGSTRQGNLIVLPGERLSRGPADADIPAAALTGEAAIGELDDVEDVESGEFAADGQDAVGEDGRRRRRRRGGRGRGRGRRGETDSFAPTEAGATVGAEEDEEDFEDVAPTQPPHQTFGSVWDSQIGVSSSATASSTFEPGGDFDEDEDLEEPEVPEYLLAERRQRGQRPQGGRGARPARGRSAYQAALDRERYGNRTPQPTYGSGGNSSGGNSSGGGRPDRNRDRGRGGRPQQGGRPMDRAPRNDRPVMSEARTSSEPWSEVPPEIEELLRAELARKSPSGAGAGQAPELVETRSDDSGLAFSASPDDQSPAPVAKAPAPRRSTRSTKSAASTASSTATAEPAADGPAEEAPTAKPKTRTTRASTTKSSTRSTTSKSKATTAATSDDDSAAAAPKKTTTRRRSTKAATEEG